MNYKHLGKYHYLYRLSFGNDKVAHVEKLPIAYSNKHYIYVIEPGSDNLKAITFNPYDTYSSGDIYTSLDESVKNKIRLYISERILKSSSNYLASYWFLIDDSEPLENFAKNILKFDLQKYYLNKDKEMLERRISNLQKDLNENLVKLATINHKLDKLEE